MAAGSVIARSATAPLRMVYNCNAMRKALVHMIWTMIPFAALAAATPLSTLHTPLLTQIALIKYSTQLIVSRILPHHQARNVCGVGAAMPVACIPAEFAIHRARSR